jgi:hypothetical protein
MVGHDEAQLSEPLSNTIMGAATHNPSTTKASSQKLCPEFLPAFSKTQHGYKRQTE